MYLVNEIFLSIQGEGPSIGHPALFIRFAGCNLDCVFCDTLHEDIRFEFETADKLVEVAVDTVEGKSEGLRCILTGGEPLLQIDKELLANLCNAGFQICLETNGTEAAVMAGPIDDCKDGTLENILEDFFSEITVSPKNLDLSDAVVRYATCIKLLHPPQFPATLEQLSQLFSVAGSWGNTDPYTKMSADIVLQPVTCRDFVDTKVNFHSAVDFQKELRDTLGVDARVIPQVHCIMGVK